MAYNIGFTIEDVTIMGNLTIPKGTQVRSITSGSGKNEWAVMSISLLIELTGNTHDPKYRWYCVPTDIVRPN